MTIPAVGRVLVVSPTYEERDTLPGVVTRLRAAVPEADLLVVDDASPDGTGLVADALAADDPQVHVLHRPGKAGLGRAYVAGFAWALDRGYDVIVEMDADGSHAPEELPRLLAALAGGGAGLPEGGSLDAPGEEQAGADVVLGSRWVPGGQVLRWPAHRRWLSRGGNLYTRLMLDLPIADATGGYRAYRASALARLPLDAVASEGYCFQVDLVWHAWRQGLDIREVPITFTERESGRSKMSRAIVAEALWRVTLWGVRHRSGRGAADGARLAGAPASRSRPSPSRPSASRPSPSRQGG